MILSHHTPATFTQFCDRHRNFNNLNVRNMIGPVDISAFFGFLSWIMIPLDELKLSNIQFTYMNLLWHIPTVTIPDIHWINLPNGAVDSLLALNEGYDHKSITITECALQNPEVIFHSEPLVLQNICAFCTSNNVRARWYNALSIPQTEEGGVNSQGAPVKSVKLYGNFTGEMY
ncbi:hypothetical protein DXG03_006839 [Asterophora parasitica]|uniref:Uncharacterized protein n=1 Tax=Asterophora parasitica TaxID=117018 RepID=A0A9P7G6S9_9AGAR|nr:hypothetical protein DXG03_006839 [Asterophora parasitica]